VPLTLLSKVHNFSPNENAWLFWPSDVLLVPTLYRCITEGRRPGPLFARYVAAKLICLALLLTLKALGVCNQDNMVFVMISGLFALPLAQFTWLPVELARDALRARQSGA
jgi:hypothetical protein